MKNKILNLALVLGVVAGVLSVYAHDAAGILGSIGVITISLFVINKKI